MDADTVRLILLVLGVLFLVGLYLWERSQGPEESAEDNDYDEDDAPYRTGLKREPSLGRMETSDATAGRERRSLHREPAAAGEDFGDEDALSEESRYDGAGEHLRTRAPGALEPLLIQLSVARRQGELEGTELMDVADACGLRPGDMDIFHCLDEFHDGTRIYFSMANMVKPGTFPFDDMERFSTPGVMLFAQLDGRPEDLTVLEEMIATARKIATTFGADVLDETRRPLTVRKEEELRNAVLANEARAARMAR